MGPTVLTTVHYTFEQPAHAQLLVWTSKYLLLLVRHPQCKLVLAAQLEQRDVVCKAICAPATTLRTSSTSQDDDVSDEVPRADEATRAPTAPPASCHYSR